MATATVNFFSQALNRTVPFNIILPAENERPEQKLFSTLYLLHGYLGNYSDWLNRTRLISFAEEKNFCVVMPSGDNKFYCDSALTGDNYGQFIGEELVSFTRKMFPLSQKREDTFIGGLSMGGFGAIANGLRHPETFSRIIALSAAMMTYSARHHEEQYPEIDANKMRQFLTMFGIEKLDDFFGSENDCEALAEKSARTGAERPSFYMACGKQDSLLTPNEEFRDLLRALGYDVTWESWDGAHEWSFWDQAIEKFIPWLPL